MSIDEKAKQIARRKAEGYVRGSVAWIDEFISSYEAAKETEQPVYSPKTFDLFVIEHLGPRALSGDTMSIIDAARLAWDSAMATKRESVCHEWKNEPSTETDPLRCLLCTDDAAVVIYAPDGCTCSPNKYQPRCRQHLSRANDTDEEFVIVEDFRIPLSKIEGGQS
jgi:hypothetical protein